MKTEKLDESTLKQKVKDWMWKRIQQDDDIGLIFVELAEDAAGYFGHPEWCDDEIHWIWEMAHDVVADARRMGLRPKIY